MTAGFVLCFTDHENITAGIWHGMVLETEFKQFGYHLQKVSDCHPRGQNAIQKQADTQYPLASSSGERVW